MQPVNCKTFPRKFYMQKLQCSPYMQKLQCAETAVMQPLHAAPARSPYTCADLAVGEWVQPLHMAGGQSPQHVQGVSRSAGTGMGSALRYTRNREWGTAPTPLLGYRPVVADSGLNVAHRG
jgi:hypothetical protein